MRRRAVEKRPEPAQQIELLLAKARDINERLRPRQHRQKAQQQHLRERIDHLAGLPRVRQILEIVQENNRLVERRQLQIRPPHRSSSQIRIRGQRQIQHSISLSRTSSPDRPVILCYKVSKKTKVGRFQSRSFSDVRYTHGNS